MAVRPPRRLTSATVSSSIRLIQSQSTFPCGCCTSSARSPIANEGVVPIPISPGSCSRNSLRKPSCCIWARVVHCCPLAPTYWRSSQQIGHASGGCSLGANCVPHVLQIQCSINLSPSFSLLHLLYRD